MHKLSKKNNGDNVQSMPVRVEYGIAFSIIVSGSHKFAIHGACKKWCPYCGKKSTVGPIQARLRIRPKRKLKRSQRLNLWRELEAEIQAKIELDMKCTANGGVTL
jgi:hypothetical protein